MARSDRDFSTDDRSHCSPAERRRILRDWQRSGLDAARFAEIAGVGRSTLYLWRRREQERRAERSMGASPTFAELILEPSANASAVGSTDAEMIEVWFENDAPRLRTSASIDADRLADLVTRLHERLAARLGSERG